MLKDKHDKDCVCSLTSGSLQQSFRRSCKRGDVNYHGRGCHGLRHAYARERVQQLITIEEKQMLQRVLVNRSKGKKADYGILSDKDKFIFASMLEKMNVIHEELGHGPNRYDLAAVYMID
ncbi:hypothetical protein [Bacillus sp. JJ722]|uniref:hypothetical protein n=1 Tax=Bacillus sp. JJ722 TaxID=3122973 RepID=UPI0030008AE9